MPFVEKTLPPEVRNEIVKRLPALDISIINQYAIMFQSDLQKPKKPSTVQVRNEKECVLKSIEATQRCFNELSIETLRDLERTNVEAIQNIANANDGLAVIWQNFEASLSGDGYENDARKERAATTELAVRLNRYMVSQGIDTNATMSGDLCWLIYTVQGALGFRRQSYSAVEKQAAEAIRLS